MSDKNSTKSKKGFSADWLVGGVLTKIGETFDRLTGRTRKPSSSLATSELIERLKMLLDSEVKDLGEKGMFVPHNIKLKMQWNKFSTDSEGAMKKLEYEMLAAAIDHINDNRYHTYQPLKIEIKPDYFTEGIKFMASFGEFDEEEKEAVVNISVPQIKVGDLIPPVEEVIQQEPEGEIYVAEFTANDKQKSVELKFLPGKRVGVGRTKENQLSIEDTSVSKIHAALVLNTENQLMVADTGSTNGTFVNGERIAYGRAFPVGENDKLKFGTIEVYLRRVPKQTDFQGSQSYQTEALPAENFQTNQDYTTGQNQPTVQSFETNRDYVTQKKEPATEVYPSNSDLNVNPTNSDVKVNPGDPPELNKTVSIYETSPAIPPPPPQVTFQNMGNYETHVEPKIEKPEPVNNQNTEADENQSQVLPTEQRIHLNFGDDEKK